MSKAGFDDAPAQGLGPMAMASAAGLCLIGAGLLVVAAFDLALAASWASAFAALGACVSLLSAWLVVARAREAGRSPSPEAAFDALLAQPGAAAAALTDAAGRIRAANSEFGAAPGEMVDRALSRILPEAEAASAAYRVAAAAARDGAGEELRPLRDGDVAGLRTLRLGGGAGLLWSLSVAAEAERAGAAPLIRRAAGGAVIHLNGAAKALAEADRAAALEALDAARAGGRDFAEAHLPDRGPVAVVSVPAPGGCEDAVIVPLRPISAPGFFEAAPVALARIALDGAIEAVNPPARALLGGGAEAGAAFSDLVEGLGRPISARLAEAAEGRGAGRADLARAVRRDRDLYLQIALKRMEAPEGPSILAVIADATDMEARERQFVQSQKMQAVGQLAGGVAHDFNNLLTAILGHCDLMALRRDETDPDFDDLQQIRQNANRAAALVRQLLAFSRQQKLDPQAVDMADLVGELSHLLGRLIGERVTLKVETGPDLWPVWADARQLEQVILNLVVNARDAMPEGGEISVSCRNLSLREELRRDRAVAHVGDYVEIRIADQGVGMSEDVRAKIFEPFFTTKRPGEGTGLGLSTAYGIVKQTGGFIFVDSAPGRGAIFTVMIPRRLGEAAAPRRSVKPTADLSGSGRLLLVEDEAPVRAFAARALRLRGYEVVEAESAEAALTILDAPDFEVDLVISDVVMPGMDGPTWIRQARLARPNLAVVFTSGYSEDVFRKGLNGLDNCGFLPKPFSLDDLASAVKARLAASPASAAA